MQGRLRLTPRRVSALVALAAAIVAVAALHLVSTTPGRLGPGTATMRISFSRHGESALQLSPIGRLVAATHRAPLRIDVDIDQLDIDQVQTALGERDPAAGIRRDVARDVIPLARRMALRALLWSAAIGAVVGLMPRHRRRQHAAIGAGAGVVACTLLLGATWRSFDERAFDTPRFEGPLERAPAMLDAVKRGVDTLDQLKGRVTAFSDQIAHLYKTVGSATASADGETTILHVSDIHLNPLGLELAARLTDAFKVDAVVDTGDLTTFGTPIEAHIAQGIASFKVPYYFVPGNHDSPANRESLASYPNVHLLDGGVAHIGPVTVLGVADPSFTADNKTSTAQEDEQVAADAPRIGELTRLTHPSVLAVHDPRMAKASIGRVPLVIAGHVHERTSEVSGSTRVLTVGSTGATGLGSFAVDTDLPYEAELLRFNARGELVSIDYVTMRGLAGDFRIERQAMSPLPPITSFALASPTSPTAG